MTRSRWIAFAATLRVSHGCFTPEAPLLDSTEGSTSSTTDPTTADPPEGSTSASPTSEGSGTSESADGSTTGEPDDTAASTDATGSTSEVGTTTAIESSSSEGEGEDSSTTGAAVACIPGPVETEFESLGDFISQGDGWQSFTADSDGDIVEVDFYWNLSGTNDAFTVNLYEGQGTGGPLLHSETFPGQGQGTWVGFDLNLLGVPVPIAAGTIYTVQGVDTFGWQTASGAIQGGTSSFGQGQHKNIRVRIQPCL